MGFASKFKGFLQTSKAKVLGAVAAAAVCVDTASAAVTFSKDNGFTGDFDLTYFYSAIGIIVTAIAIVAAIGLALRQFRKI
nr:hypothetical protein [uncultured Campylobacter sp.]